MRNGHVIGIVLGGLALMPLAAASAELVTRYHTAMCDASAGAILSEDIFVAANDEDNALRLYRRDRDGGPVGVLELSRFLRVDQEHPESDIEGAARLGDRLYWITSHGNNKDGKYRSSRHRFFATDVRRAGQDVTLVPVGKPHKNLLRDMMKERRLRSLDLGAASRLAPKDEGGLNIEALCPTPEGRLLVGFRNPIPQGRALLLILLNPEGVLKGQSAQFGDPLFLELGGYGIRDMVWTGRDYLVVAGSYDAEGVSRMYRWDGRSTKPEPLGAVSFQGFNPEAVLIDPADASRVLVLSDDGTLQVDGTDCKNVDDPNLKRFRSRWMALPPAVP